MSFMDRVKAMDPEAIARRPEVKALWDKSLFWTLSYRRSFRCSIGIKLLKDDFFDYEPKKEPVPLTEVELALLCWAGAGTSGLIRNDHTFAEHACSTPWFEGRVYPSACNIWYAHLIFANDDGAFLYRPHVPTKIVEIEKQEDMAVIFKAFKEGVVQLSDQSIVLTEREKAPPSADPEKRTTQFGTEFMFQPGVTNFFPILDITVETLNVYLMLYQLGTQLVDDEKGKLAGVQDWVDKGHLGAKKLPLRVYETGITQILISHQFYIHQNLLLCATAMGLGGYVTGGGHSTFTLLSDTLGKSGRGFRFVTDKQGYSYPVGIDGIIETHMPPYMSMDEAVEDVWNMKFKPGYGRYTPDVKEGDEVIYRGFDAKPRAVHRPFKDVDKYTRAAWLEPQEAVQIAKDVANYTYDTYGRFPKLFNPILCEHYVQILHIDPDFYDRYQVEGSIWREQREHMDIWHKYRGNRDMPTFTTLLE